MINIFETFLEQFYFFWEFSVRPQAHFLNRMLVYLFHLLFGSFNFLLLLVIVPASNLSTILKMNGDSRQPCLIPHFSGITLNYSLFKMMLVVGFTYINYIVLKYIPSNPTQVKIFITKSYWIFSKSFSVFVEKIMISCIKVHLCDLVHLLTWKDWNMHRIEPTWPWQIIFLIHVCILYSVCKYFIENFWVYIHYRY